MKRYRRQNPPRDVTPPPGWAAAGMGEGEFGGWHSTDKAEFYHAGEEIVEWILRADKKEVETLVYTLKLGFWVRTALQWVRWTVYAFTVGLAAAVAVGGNLQKLGGMISDFVSVARGLFP